MTTWAPKRFWKEATVGEVSGSLTVLLDGRPIRTPSKALLALPSTALALAVAGEWAAQEETVRPETMPMTRFANTALDRVAPEFEAVAGIVAAFGETDLLCYRADGPAELVRRQAEAWDPLLDWAAGKYGVRLIATSGVLPVEQPASTVERLAAEVSSLSHWELTALHELVSLTGSLILGFAVAEKARPAASVWGLSRIDEDWQVEQWGEDAEAIAASERRRVEFLDAVRFLDLVRGIA